MPSTKIYIQLSSLSVRKKDIIGKWVYVEAIVGSSRTHEFYHKCTSNDNLLNPSSTHKK